VRSLGFAVSSYKARGIDAKDLVQNGKVANTLAESCGMRQQRLCEA
jgi:hypothetical protein